MRIHKLSVHFLIILFLITLLFYQSIAKENGSQATGIEKLKAHSNEFKKEVIKLTEGIFVAVGFGAANSVLIEGPESVIIVDTMEGIEAAENALAAFHNITNKPISAIIYTHGHGDHIGVASVFARETNPEIYARSNLMTGLEGPEQLTDIMIKGIKKRNQ